jgi:hypothetical protein
MTDEITQKLEEQGKKIEEIRVSIDKMRKYFLWTLIVTVATIVLPLIGIMFILPWLMNTLMSAYSIQ